MHKTQIHKHSDLPTDIEITEVMFEIWDFNKISAFEKRMGMARVKIDTLLDGKEHDLWLTLERQKESKKKERK